MKIYKKIKRKLLNRLTKHLFNTITSDDILRYDKKLNKFFVGKKELSHKNVQALTKDAMTIKELPLWEFLTKDVKNISNKQMFENSNNDDDIVFGKAMLYVLSLLELKINNLAKLKIK